MFEQCEKRIQGKKIALFGSYGWGDGEWMRTWEDRCIEDEAVIACECVICNEAPDAEAEEACRKLEVHWPETDRQTADKGKRGIFVNSMRKCWALPFLSIIAYNDHKVSMTEVRDNRGGIAEEIQIKHEEESNGALYRFKKIKKGDVFFC